MGQEQEIQTHKDIVVSVASTEQLTNEDHPHGVSCLEVKRKSRLYNYLYGPYSQHQFLVDCVLKLKDRNRNVGKEETPGRMLRMAPSHTHCAGRVFSQLTWYLGILLPCIFIILCYVGYNMWMVCGCAITLCLLISVHSIAIFFILHNQKISNRYWFVNKVDLDHRHGRENEVVEVTLEDTASMQFLSAGRRSQVIAHLAQSQDKKGVLMLCTKSFWISHVLDPLLCFLFLIVLSLIVLIVDIDMMRRHHM